jgi:hypothetical protein
MNHIVLACLLMAAIGCCGCAENHHVAASEFQRSCAVDSDCLPIYEGDLHCCGPDCPNAAINQVDESAYWSAVAKRTPTCSPSPPCAPITSASCGARAICSNGMCAFEKFGADASAPD